MCRHQRWLDKHIGAIQWQLLDTVSSTRSLSVPLVSRGNESYMYYNINSPSASPMTVVGNCCIHTRTCATYTNHGYYSRPAFILFSLWWIMGAGQRPKYNRWRHSTSSTMNELYSGISWHNRFWCALYACYEIMSSYENTDSTVVRTCDCVATIRGQHLFEEIQYYGRGPWLEKEVLEFRMLDAWKNL